MLHIILLILKLIGIVIGILAGIFLLVVLLALFVPLHYAAGLKADSDNQLAEIKAGWLMRMLYLRVLFNDGKLIVRFRVAGLLLYDNQRPKRQKRKRLKSREETKQLEKEDKVEKEQLSQDQEVIKEKQDLLPGDCLPKEERTDDQQEQERASGQAMPEEQEQAIDMDQMAEPAKESKANDKLNFFERLIKAVSDLIRTIICRIKKIISLILNIIAKVREFIINFRQKLKGVAALAKKIKDKIWLVRDFLMLEENRNGIKGVIGMVKDFGKHVLPSRISGTITFGTGDAYTTGQILTYAAMFYGFYGSKFDLMVDFEHKRLEGELKLKGRIRMGQVLLYLFRLWRNKEFKKLLKNIRKLREELS